MQNVLNVLDSYCMKWKLTVNCKKTKVLIFRGNTLFFKNFLLLYKNAFYRFTLENQRWIKQKVTNILVFFITNHIITKSKIMLYTQAQKRLCILFYDKTDVNIFLLCQLKIFDYMALPIPMYRSGFGALKIWH